MAQWLRTPPVSETTALAVEKRESGRHRHLADEDISGLDFAGLGQIVDDRRSAMNSAGDAPVPVMTSGPARLHWNAKHFPQNRLSRGSSLGGGGSPIVGGGMICDHVHFCLPFGCQSLLVRS
jgi:hypothetical protein